MDKPRLAMSVSKNLVLEGLIVAVLADDIVARDTCPCKVGQAVTEAEDDSQSRLAAVVVKLG